MLAAIVWSSGAGAQNGPLPDRDPFFQATRENLARSQREQYRYAYKERRTEFHRNPFGRIGTGDIVVYDVTPGPEPDRYRRRLIERNGKPVTNAPLETQNVPPQRDRSTSSLDDVVATLDMSIDRRETVGSSSTIVVKFAPKPDARPRTRQGRIAKAFTGTVWVDEVEKEVIRVEGVAIDDLSFGYGLLARLNEGTTVTATREKVAGGMWLPTSVRFVGQGRAMVFRSLNVDFVIEWFDYRRVGEP